MCICSGKLLIKLGWKENEILHTKRCYLKRIINLLRSKKSPPPAPEIKIIKINPVKIKEIKIPKVKEAKIKPTKIKPIKNNFNNKNLCCNCGIRFGGKIYNYKPVIIDGNNYCEDCAKKF